MYILGKIPLSTANGPGRRCLIHVQGCTLSCPSCWNPQSHQHGLGNNIEPADLARWVQSLDGIEGLTLSGGEPLQQGPELYTLLRLIRTTRPDLSIGMFTGYTRKELEAGEFHWFNGSRMLSGFDLMWQHIASSLDFAVMGRYNQRLHTQGKALCGSSNQTIELFSDRYQLSDFQSQAAEVIISPDGQLVHVTGFPRSHEKLKVGLS